MTIYYILTYNQIISIQFKLDENRRYYHGTVSILLRRAQSI